MRSWLRHARWWLVRRYRPCGWGTRAHKAPKLVEGTLGCMRCGKSVSRVLWSYNPGLPGDPKPISYEYW